MNELYLRVRRQSEGESGVTALWLLEQDGAAIQQRMHGAMWTDAADRVIEIFERAGVRIERETMPVPAEPNQTQLF